MVFMRGSDKRKYWELIHDFSIQYAINNNQYTKILQEAVYVMRKVKFKPEKIMIKVTHTKKGAVIEINQMKQVFH